jgi:histidyl-tRNA synthetase
MSSQSIQAVKGMHDILPSSALGVAKDEASVERWLAMEATIRRVVSLHGYREIRTPIIEPTSLFVRSVGEGTDIVDKEMYSFTFHDEPLTVRPEGTASVVRAYVEHGIAAKEPVSRFFYQGPMFRGERPARGRQRQFHQAGCELFGDPGPLVDAEMIAMLVGLLGELGIGEVEVLVSSLGSKGTKAKFRELLVAHLQPMKDALSADSQRRLGQNPLRILDSKHKQDQEAIATAPSILDVLDEADRAHFDGLRRALDALGAPYRVDTSLVRGLDYYSRTVFELRGRGGELGAQNALGGGGRYDGLVEELGGPATPGIGFALGLERLLLATPQKAEDAGIPVFLAPVGEAAGHLALRLANQLRAAGVAALLEGRGGSLKSMLRRANSVRADLVLIIGERELENGVVALKDLGAQTQTEVAIGEVVAAVVSAIGAKRPAGERP